MHKCQKHKYFHFWKPCPMCIQELEYEKIRKQEEEDNIIPIVIASNIFNFDSATQIHENQDVQKFDGFQDGQSGGGGAERSFEPIYESPSINPEPVHFETPEPIHESYSSPSYESSSSFDSGSSDCGGSSSD